MKLLENNKNKALAMKKFQIPLEQTIRSFKIQLAKIFNKQAVFKYNIDSSSIRLWGPDNKFATLNDFRDYLHQCCEKSRTYDYKIDYNGKLLDRVPSNYLEEINPDLKEPFIIEINEPGKSWTFYNDFVKACKKCAHCAKIDFLDYDCLCGKVNLISL